MLIGQFVHQRRRLPKWRLVTNHNTKLGLKLNKLHVLSHYVVFTVYYWKDSTWSEIPDVPLSVFLIPFRQVARQRIQQATAIPVRSSPSVYSGGRVGGPPVKSDRHITHYVRLKLTLRLPFSLTLNNHTSSKVTINHTQSGISLKSFTINKHPKVFKIYNKRIHSHLYSMFTTMWCMADCIQDTQQFHAWSTVFNTHNKLTHGQLYSILTTNWHMANCIQYS